LVLSNSDPELQDSQVVLPEESRIHDKLLAQARVSWIVREHVTATCNTKLK